MSPRLHPRTPALAREVCLIALALGLAPAARAFENDAWVGQDKVLHLTASAVIASSGYTATQLATDDALVAALAGGALALGAGVAKEVYDVARGSDASFRDLAWDAVGVGLGLATTWCLLELVAAAVRAPPVGVAEKRRDGEPASSGEAVSPGAPPAP